MPKRSLNPPNNAPNGDAKKIEQLNRAVEVLLTRADGRPAKVEAALSHWCAWPRTCATCLGKSSRHD